MLRGFNLGSLEISFPHPSAPSAHSSVLYPQDLQSGEMIGLLYFLHRTCSTVTHSADQVGKFLSIWEKKKEP